MTDQPSETSKTSAPAEPTIEESPTDATRLTPAEVVAEHLAPPSAPTTPPPLALVRFEGQELELEDSIAREDQAIIAALSAWYPMLATAKFTRSTAPDGRLVVEATKQGGTKGQGGPRPSGFCAHLDAADDALHPAVRLALEFDALERAGRLSLSDRLARATEIEAALASLRDQLATLNTFTRLMDHADPSPLRSIPLGF